MKLFRGSMFVDGARPSIWKGLVAGAVGGLAGTMAMTAFQKAWSATDDKLSAKSREVAAASKQMRLENGHHREEEGNRHQEGQSHEQPLAIERHAKKQQGDGPTEKVAARIAALARLELSPDQKQSAGQVVHFAFGTLLGAAYGAALELRPELRRSRRPSLQGLGYGSAVFVGADEIALPAFELTGNFKEMPLSSHVYGLASHLVYGVVAEIARRTVRNAL